MYRSIVVSIILVAASTVWLGAQEEPRLKAIPLGESAGEFARSIRPLLVKYCADCHSPKAMDGLDFLEAQSDSDLAKLRGVYAAVVEQLENRMMPPAGEEQPSQSERTTMTEWIRKSFDLNKSDTDRIAQYVVAAYEDKKGNLWFGTTAKGAVRFDGKTLTWFSTKEGLPSTVVTSFAEDKDGNLWMGTHEGICKFDGRTITRMRSAEGLPAVDPGKRSALPAGGGGVRADRDGNIWANMNHGVYRFDGNKFVEFKVPFDKKESSSYAIFNGRPAMKLHDRDGNLWFGTDGYGVFKFDGKTFTHFDKQDGLCSNSVNRILQDRQGNIWFACMQSYQPNMTGDGGVCRFDGNKFTSFQDIKGLSQNDIYTIYETRAGELWIGATHVGAYRLDEDRFTLFDETDRTHWTRHFGLQAMLEDRNGTLWCGFSGGLFRFNGKSFSNVTQDDLRSEKPSQEQQKKEVENILRPRQTLGLEMSYPSSVSFSSDNMRVIIANQDNVARLLDVNQESQTYGKLLLTLEGHTSGVSAASFSSDGKHAITGSLDNTARMWDVDPTSPKYGMSILTLEGHTGGLYCASFSPEGRRVLTGGRDNTARLWNVDPISQSYGKLLRTLSGHKFQVVVSLFSPDGRRLLTGSNDNTARLWDADPQSATIGQEFPGIGVGKTGYLLAGSFSPDGRNLLTGTADNTARLFDANPNSPTYGRPIVTLRGHSGWLRAASFSTDGKRILTGSDDKTARLWDADPKSANFGTQTALIEADQPITSADFSPDGSRVVLGVGTWDSDPAKSRGEVQIWNIAE